MAKSRLHFAVIGLGRIGKRRIETILRHPQTELTCVSDVDDKTGKAIAQEHKCVYYKDFEDAASNSEVDCVIVATPNKFHTPVSIVALKNKKQVFCEKPLARNPEEALAMVRTALENKVFLKTGSNLRYFPSVLKAKELLNDNRIGDLLFVRGWIGNSGWHLNSWFSDPEMAGGGTFLDNGCHLLDIIRWLYGEVKECVGYVSTSHLHNSPLEDNGVGIFKTLDEKLAFIHSSWTEWNEYMYMEIYGTEGYLYVENRNKLCKTILGDKHGAQNVFDYSLQAPVSFKLELEDFVKAMQDRRQPLPSGYDGLRAVQMAYGVYESAKTGQTVRIYGETEERLARLINSTYSLETPYLLDAS